jgi:hypothetical protein
MRNPGFWVSVLLAVTVACSEPSVDLPTPRALGTPLFDDFAHQKFATPLSLGDAEQILLQTEVFRLGPSNQVSAWNVIVDQPDASARFQSILIKARIEGKLYAWCGLFAVDPDRAEQEAKRILSLRSNVSVLEGDMGYYKTPAAMIELMRWRRLWEQFRADKSK